MNMPNVIFVNAGLEFLASHNRHFYYKLTLSHYFLPETTSFPLLPPTPCGQNNFVLEGMSLHRAKRAALLCHVNCTVDLLQLLLFGHSRQ